MFKVHYLFSPYPHEAGVKYKIHFVLINGQVDLPGAGVEMMAAQETQSPHTHAGELLWLF